MYQPTQKSLFPTRFPENFPLYQTSPPPNTLKSKKKFPSLLKNLPSPPTPLKFPSLSNLLSPYFSKIEEEKNCPTLLKINLSPPRTSSYPYYPKIKNINVLPYSKITPSPKISFSAQPPPTLFYLQIKKIASPYSKINPP